jgi:MFS family permease
VGAQSVRQRGGALFLGRLTDRLSNKAILAVTLPAYFLCTLGHVYANAGDSRQMQLLLLYVLHFLMGMASGGIRLASSRSASM